MPIGRLGINLTYLRAATRLDLKRNVRKATEKGEEGHYHQEVPPELPAESKQAGGTEGAFKRNFAQVREVSR